MKAKLILGIVWGMTIAHASVSTPLLQYRMDECQWLGNGITDVRDNSSHALDGEAMNGVQTVHDDAMVGFSGGFNLSGDNDEHIVVSHNDALNIDQNFTMTFWVKPSTSEDAHLLYKYNAQGTKDKNDDSGFKIHYVNNPNNNIYKLRLNIAIDNQAYKLNIDISENDWSDGDWHFIVTRYDGSALYLAFDDTNATTSASGSVVNATDKDLLIGIKEGLSKDFNGYIDEVKIWDEALSYSDIEQIRSSESNGKNFDDSDRDTPTCEGSIEAHSWKMIGIPADLRDSSYDIDDILGDDMNGSYGDDWRIYTREYSDSNNSSWYTYLSETNTTLEFGKGYYLASKNDENWSVSDLPSVDYNATCASNQTANRCVEIDLVSVSLSEDDGDDLLGTGPYRYNLLGFIGTTPVHWSDCRIVVGGTAYTPEQSADHNYTSRTLWMYNPGDTKASSKGYTTFTDLDSYDWLIPYRGFWIEMQSASKNKDIKLLIPQE